MSLTPAPVSAPGPPRVDPFEPARALERVLWDVPLRLDDVHAMAVADGRPLADTPALADRIRAMAETATRLAVLVDDTGEGPARAGELFRLAESGTPLRTAGDGPAAQELAVAITFLNQAAVALGSVAGLMSAAARVLDGVHPVESVSALAVPGGGDGQPTASAAA